MQTNKPNQSIVFADADGYYDFISSLLPSSSSVIIPVTAGASFRDLDKLLLNVEQTGMFIWFFTIWILMTSIDILFLWSLQDDSNFAVNSFSQLVAVARTFIQMKVFRSCVIIINME